jgi:four helix bundle protein
MQNESSNLKMQNENSKFKEEFLKRLIKFSIWTVKFAKKLQKEKILWPIIDQLIRSSTSIGANVVEAKASSSKRDYIHYFEIALKSANETKCWLILIQETMPNFKEEITQLLKEVAEISKILASGILTMKGQR